MSLNPTDSSPSYDAEPSDTHRELNPGEVLLARFSGFNALGQVLVEYNQEPAQVASSTISLEHSDIDRQVVLMFINQDFKQPIVTGLVRSPLYDMLKRPATYATQSEESFEDASAPFDNELNLLSAQEQLTVDGKKVLIEGSEEVVLKCGEASITLTKAGKVLIRGKYLSSRSSGVNKILGGSVQVN